MRTRSLIQRIERAEETLKVQSIFSAGCICFPEKERPLFGFPIEMEIVDKVKCPLHGKRFTPLFHLASRNGFGKTLEAFVDSSYRAIPEGMVCQLSTPALACGRRGNRDRRDLLEAEGWKQAPGLRISLEAPQTDRYRTGPTPCRLAA